MTCLLFVSCKKDLVTPRNVQEIIVPATHNLNSILFINDTLGYIAGGDKYFDSELLVTRDGGQTWSRMAADWTAQKGIYDLAVNGNGIFAVGYEGKVYLKSDSGPGEWQRVTTPYWDTWFQAIAFAAPGRGFIVSGEGYRAGRIFSTDPGGNLTLIDTFEYQLSDIEFINSNIGYTCGYGAVMKTTDGGTHWTLQNIGGDFFKAMSCIGTDEVWIVGYSGTIIHTADGGQHWEKQRNGDNPLLKRYRLRSVVFKDRQTGYAAGDKGLIIKTTDGGKHWVELERVTDHDFRCIILHPDGSLWLAGAAGSLFRITD